MVKAVNSFFEKQAAFGSLPGADPPPLSSLSPLGTILIKNIIFIQVLRGV